PAPPAPAPPADVAVAVVLPGGASLGAVQIGMLGSLAEAGVEPDLLVGSSVGAVNATYIAFYGGLSGLPDAEEIWQGVRRGTFLALRPGTAALGLSGRRPHLGSAAALRAFLRGHLGSARLEEAQVPVAVVAADVASGEAVVLTEGDAVGAVLASTAMPGILPPVAIGGRLLVDGSIAADMPVLQAEQLGASMIYVLSTRPPTAAAPPPRSVVAMVMRSMFLLMDRVNAADLADVASRCQVRVIPAPPVGELSPFDFRHTAALIARGRATAAAWLRSGAGAGLPGPAEQR
ncbi:MAG: patatin-like phospholipase family protein, partial [Acidimicrobiales bacterium]